MWCGTCHYGSDVWSPSGHDQGTWRCPQCGSSTKPVDENPFPDHPTGMGSGRSREEVEKEMAKKGLGKGGSDAVISEEVAEIFKSAKHNQ